MTREKNAITSAQPVEVGTGSGADTPRAWTYRPNVDIFETADELLLLADMPGADGDSIDVALESGILTIQAQVPSRSRAGARGLLHEFGVGNFHRRFEVDETLDPEAVTAEYRDGTLTVHLPKAKAARRRRIPVSA